MYSEYWSRFLIVMLLSILLFSAASAAPAYDPVTGRVRILYLGESVGRPMSYFAQEPVFALTLVPAGVALGKPEDEARRLMRLYMPRSFDDFISRYDISVISDARVDFFTVDQHEWFRRAVVDEGHGLLMVGGWHTFGGALGWGIPWTGTSVEEVLPVNCMEHETRESLCIRPQPVDPSHELSSALPWNSAHTFNGLNLVEVKQGATELLRPHTGAPYPILVYWEPGRGSAVAHAPDWNPGWGSTFWTWEYYPDYAVNMLYLTARMGIPQNPALMHFLRLDMQKYAEGRDYVSRLMDFVENFGGDWAPLEADLIAIDTLKAEANTLYLEQDFDAVVDKMLEVWDAFSDIDRKAMRLKNRALFWVYLSEWLILTGTLMISSYVLWTLMVGRRLYREVASTRLASTD